MSEVNNIPEGWVETNLGEVAEIGSSKRIFFSDYVSEGVPFYRSKEVIEKQKGNDISSELFITEEKFQEIDNRFGSPQQNDLLLTSVGTLGVPYLVQENEKFYFKDGNLTWFKNYKNIEPYFLYNWLLSSIGKDSLKKITIGSTQSALTIAGLRTIPILLPQLSEQKSIADILTALQAQNKTLEETAQTIFKEWFGKYQIGDELPEGWRNFKLSELVETINGYSYKGSELVEESEEALVTLKSFDRNGGFQTRGFKPFKGNPKLSQEVKIGDLVVAHTDLTQDADVLGNPAFIFDDGGFKKMYITMDLVKVKPIHNDISISFLYYLMKEESFKGHCVGYSNGTTVLHLSKKAIPEYQLLLPFDFKIIKHFSEIADRTTNKISLNKVTIQSLTQTRDELLPKLMVGDVI